MEIEVPLQPKELQFYKLVQDSPATHIGAGGSRGGGKSHGGRSIMVLRRLKYPGTRGMIFRRIYDDVWENHIQKFFEQWPFMKSWYSDKHKEITFPNASVLCFRYAEYEKDIDSFLGKEYMDILLDEATQVSEKGLVKFEGCNRWGSMEGKILHTMNPGGPGHSYMHRLYIKREYHGEEKAEDYAFLPMRAWDNVHWARKALAEASLSDKDYYSRMTDEERFEFFIHSTPYGRKLNALPASLRVGWLLGNWDKFAGQYFDCFNPDISVMPSRLDKDWYPLWLGIDWGFKHPSACYWFARVGKITKVYREFVANGRSPKALAQDIVDSTDEDERERIDAIYLDPSAFGHLPGARMLKRGMQDTIDRQMGQVFRANGMPHPAKADNDRVGGASLLYTLFKEREIEIDPSCRQLIECLPQIASDEDSYQGEDTIKFDGDDPYDALRYGMKSRRRPVEAPAEERAAERLEKFAASRGKTVEEMEPTSRAMLSRRALREARLSGKRKHFPLGRSWRPGMRPQPDA